MSEELDRLWVLRSLDEEVATLRASVARFPVERSTLAQRLAAERARLEALKQRFAEVQKARRQLEKDAEVITEQERKFLSQLPAIKKNEEYTALLHEISVAREKRSIVETEILLKLEDEERVQGERPTLEGGLREVERETAERLKALEAGEAREREALAALEARRAAEIERLSTATRARYERVSSSRDGRAVVPILKGACGGCYRGQPPQVLQEARRRDRLITCEGCGRLLIWPPDPA